MLTASSRLGTDSMTSTKRISIALAKPPLAGRTVRSTGMAALGTAALAGVRAAAGVALAAAATLRCFASGDALGCSSGRLSPASGSNPRVAVGLCSPRAAISASRATATQPSPSTGA